VKTTLALSLLALFVALPTVARAHKPSDSYLTLHAEERALHGVWDVALRDLDADMRIDDDGDGALTWAEVRAHEAQVRTTLIDALHLTRDDAACPLILGDLALIEHSDGRYVRFPWRAECARDAGAFHIEYLLFFARDPQHRAVVHVMQGDVERTDVWTAAQHTLTFVARESETGGAVAMIRQGIEHILSGLDHVLFLLALLLPSVLRSRDEPSSIGRQLRAVLVDVLKVVTAFTVAHSLTLALSALGLVSMSAAVIEPAIAASVLIAALDNLWPVFGDDRWSIGFALGLLHGFGFSSALSDLGLSGAALLRGLFSFNLGVELGQLAIVLAFVPVAFLLRKGWLYRFGFLRGGSLAIAALSLLWFVERVRGG